MKVKLEPIEYAAMQAQYVQHKIPGGADALMINLSLMPESFWNSWWGSDSARNMAKVHNPQVDTLLAKAKTVEDLAARGAVYEEISTLVTKDAPWLFVVSDLSPRTTAPNVHGFVPAPSWFVDRLPCRSGGDLP